MSAIKFGGRPRNLFILYIKIYLIEILNELLINYQNNHHIQTLIIGLQKMKKGKRQFVQKNQLMGQNGQQTTEHITKTKFQQQYPPEQSLNMNHSLVRNQNNQSSHIDKTSLINIQNQQNKQIDLEADERKKKIQLLKQKYLHKKQNNQPPTNPSTTFYKDVISDDKKQTENGQITTQQQNNKKNIYLDNTSIKEQIVEKRINLLTQNNQQKNISNKITQQQQIKSQKPTLQIKRKLPPPLPVKPSNANLNTKFINQNGKIPEKNVQQTNYLNKNTVFPIEESTETPNQNYSRTYEDNLSYQNQKQSTAYLLDQKLQKQPQEVQAITQQANSHPNTINLKQAFTKYFQNNIESSLTILYGKNSIYSHQQRQSSQGLNLQPINGEISNHMKNLINIFGINNKVVLTKDQKQVIYDIIVEYYFGKNKKISEVFVVMLVKLGRHYLHKYVNIFSQLNKNIGIIQKWKNVFLWQQLQQFCNFYIEDLNIQLEEDFILLLTLAPNYQRLLNKIYKNKIQKPVNILTILCLIKPIKQNQPSLTLYLKLINGILETVKQMGLLENLLTNFKQVQFTDKLYNLYKNILSKIIKEISDLQTNIPTNKNVPQNQSNGFLGYFNKAIDKIKTNVVNNISSTTVSNPPPTNLKKQPTQPQVIWDTQLKRYRINGEIPKDQDNKPFEEEEVKKPLPPPPPRGNKPPGPPAKKGRVITNRYS